MFSRRRIPFVPQMESVECGVACLTMALHHFGCHVDLSELREVSGVSRDGVNARTLVRVAEAYGLRARPRRLEPADLASVRGLAILHWEMNHFVLLDRWAPTRVDLLDPAIGPRAVSPDDFDRSFTGVVIELEPGEGFTRRPRRRVTFGLWTSRLREALPALGVIAGASLMVSALGMAVPVATQLLVDAVIGEGQSNWLGVVGLVTLSVVAMHGLTAAVRLGVLSAVRRHLDVVVSTQFVAHLVSLPLRFFTQRFTADLVGRVRSLRVVRELLAGDAVALLVDSALLAGYLALIFANEWRLGLVVSLGCALYVGVFALARPAQTAAYRERIIKEVKQDQQLLQIVQGIQTIRSAGREHVAYNAWLKSLTHAVNAATAESRLRAVTDAALTAVHFAVPVGVLAWGAALVASSRLTLGALLGVQLLQGAVLGPLDRVVRTLLRVLQLPLVAERLDDVLRASPEATGSTPCPRLEGRVRFERVSFRYSDTAPNVIDDVSFAVRAGEKVALVGPSGSGKSTLGKLLLGLFKPVDGRVFVDDHDLTSLDLATVRRQFGVVLQETLLFDGTVRENIALYHRRASLQDIVAAARVAQIHDDIQALPNGYDTRVGASGGVFSGGQRQRLALARAILHRPSVMILDEATSALDPTTESAIEQFLSSRACTRIVIAHRLSTVRDADRILVLDQGRVVEEGRHDELVALGGLYARLVTSGTEPHAARAAAPARARERDAPDLAPFAVLRGLTGEAREALARRLEPRSITAGSPLVQQGERAPGLFLVVSGSLDVVIQEPGLAPFKVAPVGAGAVIGEVSLLDGSPASATVVATEPVAALHLDAGAFDALVRERDPVALGLTLGLAGLVAERIRATDERRAEAGLDEVPTVALTRKERAAAPVGLDGTALGASLTEPELAAVRALGEAREVAPGEALYRPGETPGETWLVLRGRFAVTRPGLSGALRVVGAGDVLGEEGFFAPSPRADGAVAIDPASVFVIDHARLRERLEASDLACWKVLRHLARGVVRDLRLANLRLREARAVRDRELDEAFRAREEALRVSRAEDLNLTARALDASGDRAPVVRAEDARLPLVACVAAVLRHHGRAVAVPIVYDACTENGEAMVETVERGVRSFGMRFRVLSLAAGDLVDLDDPLVVRWSTGRYLVAWRGRDGGLDVMDPSTGPRRASPDEIRREFAGVAYEIVPGDRSPPPGLAERAREIVRRRGRAAVPLVVATALVQCAALVAPASVGLVIEDVVPAGDLRLLGVIAGAMLAAVALRALVGFERQRAAIYLRTQLDVGLLAGLVRHALRLPIAFFDRLAPGALIERLDSFRQLRNLLGDEALLAALDVPALAVAVLYAFALDARLAAFAATALGLYAAAITLAAGRLGAMADDEREAAAEQRGRLLEVLQGVVTLRMAGDDGVAMRHWVPSFLRELAVNQRQDLTVSGLRIGLGFVRDATLATVTWWGTSRVLAGDLALGSLVAFAGVLAGALVTFEATAAHLAGLARARTAARQVAELFAEEPEQACEAVTAPGRLRGRITLDGVSFGYSHGGPLVLRDVSLEIAAGSKVAIVGASGSGKSTLGKLLLGFYMPTSGRVLFDGKDLRGLDLSAVRSQLGVVLQETFLFTGSVRSNLALNAPGTSLRDVARAAGRAAIHDVIDRLPMRYETVVSEGGAAFSGGQRQRLALARALVSEPAIVLLDEATSALDNLTQATVEANLASLGCTRVVIAHRLSTVIDADVIVVIDKGRVVETGTHAELIARKGRYRALAQAQLA